MSPTSSRPTTAMPVDPSPSGDYLRSLLSGEVADGEAVIRRLLAAGTSPRDVCVDVLAPALNAVGDLWQHREVTVAQEHLASAITMSHLSHLAASMPRAPRNDRLVVLSGSPGEFHVVGLRMLQAFLEADGYAVLSLGMSVPADDLVEFVDGRRPDVVGLTTALSAHLTEVRPLVERLKALPARPLVMVGGAAYGGDAALAGRLGADLYAPDARTAVAALAALLG